MLKNNKLSSMQSMILTVSLALLLSLLFPAFADRLDEDAARLVAQTQIEIDRQNRIINSGIYMAQSEKYSLECIVPIYDAISDETILFIAELAPVGFIAISTDTDIMPVIAYSFENDFGFDDNPRNILLHMLKNDMILRHNALPITSTDIILENNRLWDEYLSSTPEFIKLRVITEVHGYWLDTRWGQGHPYNLYCPIDPETDEKCVTGCTCTAMAQILNYWEYPTRIQFSSTDDYSSEITTPNIWIDATTASIDTVEYNTSIGVNPTVQMRAKLMFACGVVVHAQYSSHGTSAGFSANNFTHKLDFDYAISLHGDDASFYDSLSASMIQAKPAELAIYDSHGGSGHAIVCDGYKETGEFHLNFGWSGSTDGWYFLPDGMPAGYSIVSYAVINITPPPRSDSPDDCASALELAVIEPERLRSDAIIPAGDEDWYRFHASVESSYVFYSTGSVDTRGEIYSMCGGSIVIEDDTTGEGDNFRIEFKPETSGIYFLRIIGNSDYAVGNYALHYHRALPPYVVVLLPETGEIWDENIAQTIMWEKGGIPAIDSLRVEYSLTGSEGPWLSVTNSTNNPTAFIWSPPEVCSTMTNCYIRIGDAGNDEPFDINDAPFAIRNVVSVSENKEKPKGISLDVHPNPFNSELCVNYSLIRDCHVRLDIIDLSGRCVAKLIDDDMTAGNYVRRWNCFDLPSAIYIVCISAGDDILQKRALLVE